MLSLTGGMTLSQGVCSTGTELIGFDFRELYMIPMLNVSTTRTCFVSRQYVELFGIELTNLTCLLMFLTYNRNIRVSSLFPFNCKAKYKLNTKETGFAWQHINQGLTADVIQWRPHSLKCKKKTWHLSYTFHMIPTYHIHTFHPYIPHFLFTIANYLICKLQATHSVMRL